ncbi:MAG: hypothetical protein JWR66_179 [Modestobacter sp.]|jgi:thymidylate kinase|nr:hypothetical protein [Modestobacter sp.]
MTAGTLYGGDTGADPLRASVHQTLEAAFRGLTDAGVTWALIRGADDLAHPSGDVDVLVDGAAAPRLDGILAAAGLHRMGMRGHGSHRFYFSYDADAGRWIKLDVVSRVDFGPHQEFRSPLAGPILGRRRREGSLWRLAPEDEAWLLLLHLLLDKGQIAETRREAAHAAARQATTAGPVALFLGRTIAPGADRRVVEVAFGGDAAEAEELAGFLAGRWAARRPLRTRWNRRRNRTARRLELPVALRTRGLVVALVGPDGAGKTTLSEGVRGDFPVPVRPVYMGLWQSSRWDGPLSSVPGGRVLQRTARIVRSAAAVRWHRSRGRLVLLDRFPQEALLPGSVDASRGGRLNLFLALRLAPAAQLVLLLDAPGELMFARKGEHTPELLEERRQAYVHLVEQFPDFAVLNAARSVEEVRRAALTAIWNRLHGASDVPDVASRPRRVADR